MRRRLRLYRKTRGVLLTNRYIYQGNVVTGYRIVMPDVRAMGAVGPFVEKTKKRVLTKPKGRGPEIKRRIKKW